jgi:hypothetical protein
LLTRNVTTTKEIPGEPGATITFRQLGWRQLAEAEEARSAAVLRNLKSMGGELLRDLQSINRSEAEQAAATQTAADPLAKYDQATILYAGIAAWTYSGKPTHEEIDSLDETTAKWAATEIVNLGAPLIEDKDLETRFFGSPDSSMATPSTQTVALGATLDLQTNGSSD